MLVCVLSKFGCTHGRKGVSGPGLRLVILVHARYKTRTTSHAYAHTQVWACPSGCHGRGFGTSGGIQCECLFLGLLAKSGMLTHQVFPRCHIRTCTHSTCTNITCTHSQARAYMHTHTKRKFVGLAKTGYKRCVYSVFGWNSIIIKSYTAKECDSGQPYKFACVCTQLCPVPTCGERSHVWRGPARHSAPVGH